MPTIGVAPHPEVPLGRYRHFKGEIYEVIGGVFLATAPVDEVLVLYRSTLHGYVASRHIWDFRESVLHKGRKVARFERIGDNEGE